MKKNKIITLIFFSIIGIAIIIFGIFIQIENTKFMKTAKQTDAIITSITSDYDTRDEITYNVYISYIVDNVTYNEQLDLYHSGMKKGQFVSIYYNPENPSECHSSTTASNSGYLAIGFGILWIIFAIFISTY